MKKPKFILTLLLITGLGLLTIKAHQGVVSAGSETSDSVSLKLQIENFFSKKKSPLNDHSTAPTQMVFPHALEGHLKPKANGFKNKMPSYCNIDYHREYIDVKLDLRSISIELNVGKNDVPVIAAPEFPHSTDYGEPNLPLDIFRILLPDNTVVSSVEVEILDQVFTDLEGRYYLPPNIPKAIQYGDLMGFDGRKNEQIYKSDSFFPLQPVNIEPAHLSGGNFGVLFNVYPFIFNPVQGKIKQLDYIRIRINYKEDPVNEDSKNSFINLDDFFDNQYQPLTSSTADSGFVIITTSDIVEHSEMLDLFISLKDKQGFEVFTITEDDFDSVVGQAPNERADRIRQWLIENRESLSIRYALLIGDPTPSTGDVPMKMLYPRYGTTAQWNTYSAPSDFYYSNLSGNWDLDGDEMYGEQMSIDGAISPDPLIDPDEFSIRWTGQYEVTDEGGVRLAGFFDDGCRVWLDGELVIDKWYDHLAGSFYLDIETPGLYDLIIEYYKSDKNAFFYLFQGAIGSLWFGNVHIEKFYYWDGDSYVSGGLVGSYYNDANLTDFVFSRIDPPEGVYNFRNNWMTGDRGEGGVSFNPDIIVGRIPVYNNNYHDLDNILLKSILYDTSDESLWRQSALLPMKPFDNRTPNYQLGEQIREELCLPNDFSTYRIYDEDYDCDPPPDVTPCNQDNVLQAWTSQPFGLTVWATHGSGTSANHIINSSNCSDLSNDHPAIVIQGSCNNGRPENSNNLGYSLLKDGAVATVSASRVTWYSRGTTVVTPENRWIHGYCYHTANHVINGENIGSALHLVKDISADAACNYTWMNTFGFNLYGDPTINISPPQSIHVILAEANYSYMGSIIGDGFYYDEDTVILNALTMTGYHFVEWTEDGDVVMDGDEPAVATYTFTAEANRYFTAHFAINVYNITAGPNNSEFGSVTGSDEYEHFEEVVLVATPADGFNFIYWTDNGQIISMGDEFTGETYSFVAEKDRNITANFLPDYIDVEFDANINDQIISAGDSECFNAFHTIAIGGDAPFVAEPGSQVSLISGYRILMLPGTHIEQESYLEAYIIPIWPFCEDLDIHFLAVDDAGKADHKSDDESLLTDNLQGSDKFFKVYPNPTKDEFTLELHNYEHGTYIVVEIYGMRGELIKRLELEANQQHVLSLEGQQTGIYLIRVMKGGQSGVDRLIKL